MQFRELVIKDIRRETPECVSIAFHIPEQWKDEFIFKAGQNITVKLNLNGEEIRRSYSICSSPLDGELRIAVKKIGSGKFSHFANSVLKKGDSVSVLPPTGKFMTALHPQQAKHYLAFAAGSGITPVISIIKTTLAIETKSTFTIVYGNRNRTSIIFREAIEALKNKFIQRFSVYHVLSRERTDSPVNSGRIDTEKCLELSRLIDFLRFDEIFICGPENMIFAVKDFLEKTGVRKGNIHFELFNSPVQRTASTGARQVEKDSYPAGKSLVSIKADGVTFDFELGYDSFNILDGALKQGADLPYACKGGVCSTCRARLIEGEVAMDVNFALEPDEIEAGFILTCQSHPRSPKVILDFDIRS